jgi:hypothetical protein
MAISKIGVQATGFADANVGLPIPNISLENRAAEAANGTIFFNTSNNAIEVYANGAWTTVGTGGAAEAPVIESVTGDIVSGNLNSTINITGSGFLTDGVALQGTVRFVYDGNTYDVAKTPDDGTTINGVTVPTGVTGFLPGQSGTIRFIRSDSEISNLFTKALADNKVEVQYLVVGGGGGGASSTGGGAGGGGFRTSFGPSGGGASAEPSHPTLLTTNYTVTVGAGGAAGAIGSNSTFSTINSLGGGDGGEFGGTAGSGGSGGGGGGSNVLATPGGAGTPGQGFNGGTGNPGASSTPGARMSAGGGGSGAVGGNAVNPTTYGSGGNGANSSITGVATAYAGGGGGGGDRDNPSTTGRGGAGGGGNGGDPTPATTAGTAGTVNTGGGAGGGSSGNPSDKPGGAGGSGVVILRYPTGISITNPGGGLTYSTSTSVPGYNVVTFTAGTGSIQLSN